jgi:hypothetical protein
MHSSDEFFKRTKAGTKCGEQNYLFSRVAWISCGLLCVTVAADIPKIH